MPSTDEVPSINPGDAITATYLSRMAMEINLLRREVDALKAELDQERFVEVAPVELAEVEVSGTPNVVTAKTIVRGVPNLAAEEPTIDDVGTLPDEADARVWIAEAIPALALARYMGLDASNVATFLAKVANSIEVVLSNATGSAGVNKTSPCTYVYDATIAGTDIVVGTGLSVGYSPFRAMDLQLTAATTGRGCFIDGSFVLRVADEAVAGSQECS
jgi:hypothetical protein